MERGGAGEGRDITMWFAEACRNVKGLGEVGQSENSARYRTWEREYVEQAMPRPIGEKYFIGRYEAGLVGSGL